MSVYLVQFSRDPSLIKIGFSHDPKKRIKFLESFYGTALHTYIIDDPNSSKLERQLHKHFKQLRTTLDPEIHWFKSPRPGRTEFFRIASFKDIFDLPFVDETLVKEKGYKRNFFKYSRSKLFKGNGLRSRL